MRYRIQSSCVPVLIEFAKTGFTRIWCVPALGLLLSLAFAPLTLGDDPQPPTKLADVQLNLRSLADWGRHQYTFQAEAPGGRSIAGRGRVVLSTEVRDGKVILTDEVKVTYRGESMQLNIVHECRLDNYLSPIRIESKGTGDDEFGTFVATFRDGAATVVSDEGTSVVKVPEDTVAYLALLRLVTLLPREPGRVYTFDHWLESSEMLLKHDYRIECVGYDSVAHGEKKFRCAKFAVSSQRAQVLEVWVSSRGWILRMILDERKLFELDEPYDD